MNPMYQAMMATQAMDPLQSQQQQLGQYRPAQLQAPQSGGQYGMSMGQMMGLANKQRDNRISQIDQMGSSAT